MIDCRGLGAKPAWPALRGIRGEVARVHAPGIGLTRPVRLLHPRYPLYIAPKENDLYVIGATEVEGEDMSPVTVRSALELLSAAFAVHPGFGEARILELNAHCRPTLPDHRPAIVWDGARTLRVNGLYRHGFMIAPEVADSAAQLRRGAARARRLRHRFLRRFPPPDALGRRCFTVNMPCPRSEIKDPAMNIHINQRPFDLPDAATVTDALAAFGAKPPFAVALNGQFVARARTCVEGAQYG